MKNKRYLPDHRFMKEAIALAKEAEKTGDIPVGAVVVRDGVIIGRGYNRRERDQSATAHAEICAIEDACRTLGSWHLDSCELYVTLEPCPMCAGACIQSRIRKVIYGARDPKGGSVITVQRMFQKKAYNHHPEAHGGVMKEECTAILKEYFKTKRKPK